jgi:hypothetical protein
MSAAGTVFATVYMAMMVGLPLALHRDRIAAGWAGVLVAVSAATVIVGRHVRLTRSPDPFGRMRVGYALLGLGLLMATAVAVLHPAGATYLAPVVVWSLGDVVLLGEPLAVVAGLAPDADRGRYLAAYGVSWGIATTLAPALAALLLGVAGPAGLWLACGAASVGLALGQSRLRAAVTRP